MWIDLPTISLDPIMKCNNVFMKTQPKHYHMSTVKQLIVNNNRNTVAIVQ